jgi:hypothetical protein
MESDNLATSPPASIKEAFTTKRSPPADSTSMSPVQPSVYNTLREGFRVMMEGQGQARSFTEVMHKRKRPRKILQYQHQPSSLLRASVVDFHVQNEIGRFMIKVHWGQRRDTADAEIDGTSECADVPCREWTISRRFREFDKMHQSLSKHFVFKVSACTQHIILQLTNRSGHTRRRSSRQNRSLVRWRIFSVRRTLACGRQHCTVISLRYFISHS